MRRSTKLSESGAAFCPSARVSFSAASTTYPMRARPLGSARAGRYHR
ncbi:hypothetical protein AKJ08_1979 [Vulgatibacter incomptus]|uniref:Uncharacterized protein n=1 Tax=Vulgatibacter incomptus TaxID=1391653 RepID=A0A0K1PDL2_9BACT|nr:hypothetical protein AKJ08_1979 [Vulgatibacter incomptus]